MGDERAMKASRNLTAATAIPNLQAVHAKNANYFSSEFWTAVNIQKDNPREFGNGEYYNCGVNECGRLEFAGSGQHNAGKSRDDQ
jgi:hypothetical protein